MLSAADLRFHVVDIQDPVLTKDSDGNDIQDWQTVFPNVPAKVIAASVNQLLAAKAVNSPMRGRIIIRARTGLRDNQRILYKGEPYDILGWMPDPESGNEYVTAAYVAHVNNGGF
jgi:SPP1 family predicted phage head-tail adaptor